MEGMQLARTVANLGQLPGLMEVKELCIEYSNPMVSKDPKTIPKEPIQRQDQTH
jgi:hypothetical protein